MSLVTQEVASNMIKYNIWSEIAQLRLSRCHSACTVYEGKIVITGGYNTYENLKSMETYNHHANKWKSLCDMIVGERYQSLVSLGNKMF